MMRLNDFIPEKSHNAFIQNCFSAVNPHWSIILMMTAIGPHFLKMINVFRHLLYIRYIIFR